MAPRTPEDGKGGGRDAVLSLRRNHRISVPEVQVILPDGQALGVLPTVTAISRALERRLDLVEIDPNAHPPVCRMMDFGKFVADRSKKRPDGL